MVRILNRSDRAGTVRIHAFDDIGKQFGPVTLSMDANESVNFSSTHLESGNESRGLSGGVGDGQGHWRLELDTDLDIEPLSYARNADGSLSSIHEIVANQSMRHHVLTFNPASNLTKRSRLRLVNTSGIDTEVVITGLDDRGEAPPGGEVRLTLPAGQARTLSAQALEAGGDGFEGSFGDGAGKWQVFVSADRPLQVMSLLSSTGSLHNLSTPTADDTIRGGPGGDELFGSNGDDVFDPGDNGQSDDLDADRGYDTVHGSRGDDTIIYTGSGAEALQEVRYSALSAGITATIDGPANRATVDKGTAGTDTLVNVANPLNAAGFELHGTSSNDIFNLTMDDGQFQFMDVWGGAGNDTFNVRLNGGWVRLDYGLAPSGINVDLRTGRALDDGHGGVDTFTGDIPRGIAGSEFSDVIRGSDRGERFVGRAGNDRIDGGGGLDRLQFGYSPRFAAYLDIQDLRVDLDAGTATGTWNGSPFSYTVSNIEGVIGGPGNDVIRGALEDVRGSTGNDRIVFTGDVTYGQVDYRDLSGNGITATIDGTANSATVDKGSAGTDTIVDIANPFDNDGVGFYGTNNADTFNLRLGDGQWMQVDGRAGDDTFNVQSGSRGSVRISYSSSPGGIHVDLGAGRVRNDGHGDIDTISGNVREIRGSDFSDTIIGSGNDESFIGRQGNDTINGGGGWDRLRFDRSSQTIEHLIVDLDEGFAAGTWNGKAFYYRISNIEWVRGNSSANVFWDKVGDNTFEGRGGPDVYTFIPGHGYNTITDFDVDDWILLDGFSLAITDKSDVLEAATSGPDGTTIDLSAWGGGTIFLRNFSDLSASNIRL